MKYTYIIITFFLFSLQINAQQVSLNSVNEFDIASYFNDIDIKLRKSLDDFNLKKEPFYIKNWKSVLRVVNLNKKIIKVGSSNFHIKLQKFITKIDNKSVYLWDDKGVDFFLLDYVKFKMYDDKYYQILSVGEGLIFAKNLSLKTIKKNVNPMMGERSEESFKVKNNFVLIKNGIVEKIKLKEKVILKHISENKKEFIKVYAKKNKLKFNKEKDLKKIINYYNTLN